MQHQKSPSITANIVSDISTVQRFLQVLTWKKLFQLTLFLFIIGLSWATYENREIIYGFANQKRIDPSSPHTRSLSKTTTSEINVISERSELIAGIQIILADFQKNQEIIVYTHFDDDNIELKKIYSDFEMSSIGNIPLFTSDVENNKHLVDLINGEFSCRPFNETTVGKIIIDAAKYIKFSCSNGIPASYGRFTGMIILQLKKQPRPEEFDQLRSVSRTLATTIFERDLR